ncbi:MAG: alpha/beta fold hydrolase [Bryobacteraceae bacterium]|nr:alpha/beta fold hydrolase [Bryobacteraceae bacterium]
MVLHYQVRGEGPPLFLLHGLAGSSRWWARNIEALSGSHRVYALDLPGYGGLRRSRGDFVLAAGAEWLLRAIDFLEPGVPVSLMGHSMGALVCAMLAASEVGRVDRLVLAAPAMDLQGRTIAASLWPLARACGASPLSFWPTLVSDSARAGPGLLLRSARELFAMDGRRNLHSIRAPTLLVWGERDALIPVSLAAGLQGEIAGSDLVVIPGAGHVVMWDAAEQFNRVVLAFFGTAQGKPWANTYKS